MDFRRSVPADATQISELEAQIFPDPWDYRSVQDCICSEGSMCFTAISDGKVVAYILGRLIAPEGEIYRIAVRAESRRRGIGYRLLDYGVKTSRGRGLESLFLEVRAKNVAARRLYEAYGFIRVGIRKNYYNDPKDDAIVMLKASKADIYE